MVENDSAGFSRIRSMMLPRRAVERIRSREMTVAYGVASVKNALAGIVNDVQTVPLTSFAGVRLVSFKSSAIFLTDDSLRSSS
ncbi:hypothetical protein BG842_11170 [Haladaptatus sp. W1]|nr:hypothetical protein BG842_11170 [Haladaptatus sp. W1]